MPTTVKRFNLIPEVTDYDEVMKYGVLMSKVLENAVYDKATILTHDVNFMQHQLEIQINYLLDLNEDLPKHHQDQHIINTMYELRCDLGEVLDEVEQAKGYADEICIPWKILERLYAEQRNALTVIYDTYAYLNYLQGDNPEYAREIGLE